MKHLIFILPVILLLSCGEEEDNVEEYDPARMERYVKYNNGKFEDIWLQDGRKAKAFFTPDACITYNDSMICDTSAIVDHMESLVQQGFAKQELLTMSINGNNDSLVEQGHYVIRDTSGKAAEKGTYTTTWKRHRGYFKYHLVNKKRAPGS